MPLELWNMVHMFLIIYHDIEDDLFWLKRCFSQIMTDVLWASISQPRGIFPSRGHLAMFGDGCGCYDCGWYWHLVDWGQRCCWISYNAQGSLPMTKNYPAPNVNGAKVERPFRAWWITVTISVASTKEGLIDQIAWGCGPVQEKLWNGGLDRD